MPWGRRLGRVLREGTLTAVAPDVSGPISFDDSLGDR
jgi:hypothetical protein